MSGLEYGVVAFRKSDNRIVRYQYTDVLRPHLVIDIVIAGV